MKNITLIFICTGSDYWKFITPAVESAKQFFPADILLFTDSPIQYDVAKQVSIPHAGWPNVTLMRYHTILGEREWLSAYRHIFYLDIDMQVVGPVGDEILSDGISACAHPSYVGKPGTPEENSRSSACLSRNQIRKYYAGCFIGGESKAFLSMAKVISRNIDFDNANGFIATWHDESHLNRYLYDHPPAKELRDDHNAWTKTHSTKILRVPKNQPDRPAVNGKQPFLPENSPVGILEEDETLKRETLIAIVTCNKEPYLQKLQEQRATWIPKAVAAGFDVQVFDGERLGVSDDYLSMPLKTKALCKWALRSGYKRLLKLDDDAFICVENFHIILHDYAGILILKNDCGLPLKGIPDFTDGICPFDYASGGGYWLSERSMQVLVDAPFYGEWAEDRWVGQTLGKVRIFLTILPNYYLFIPHMNMAHPRDHLKVDGYSYINFQELVVSRNLVLLAQIVKIEDFRTLHLRQIPPIDRRCNRHNMSGCVVCAQRGWQFQEPPSPPPPPRVTPPTIGLIDQAAFYRGREKQ